jgi:hypothetical protein
MSGERSRGAALGMDIEVRHGQDGLTTMRDALGTVKRCKEKSGQQGRELTGMCCDRSRWETGTLVPDCRESWTPARQPHFLHHAMVLATAPATGREVRLRI